MTPRLWIKSTLAFVVGSAGLVAVCVAIGSLGQ